MVTDSTCYGGQLHDILYYYLDYYKPVHLLRMIGMKDVKETLTVCIECLGGAAKYKLASNSNGMQIYYNADEEGLVFKNATGYFTEYGVLDKYGDRIVEKKIWIW